MLDPRPSTITPPQRQRLHGLAKRRGWDHPALSYVACSRFGCSSLGDLSRAQAHELIDFLGGRPLGPAIPPKRVVKKPGTIRLLAAEHLAQIEQLRIELGWTKDALDRWLQKTFKLDRPSRLATAERAGRAIFVLKAIRDREPTERLTVDA